MSEPPKAPADDRPDPLPFASSICHGCAHHRYVSGRATTFILCAALPNKYPPQPVLGCPAFRPADGPR